MRGTSDRFDMFLGAARGEAAGGSIGRQRGRGILCLNC